MILKSLNGLNRYSFLRLLVGILFIVSGTEKLVSHYQNFLYVIQGYELLQSPWDEVTARVFPWIELFLGIFAVLGIWTKWALRGLLVLTTMFLLVVTQALSRNLPVQECGCFGELISIPLPGILLMDSILWMTIALLIIRIEETSRCSIDEKI